MFVLRHAQAGIVYKILACLVFLKFPKVFKDFLESLKTPEICVKAKLYDNKGVIWIKIIKMKLFKMQGGRDARAPKAAFRAISITCQKCL